MATVLIVDDVPDYCEELAYALSRDRHRILTALNGREAILRGARERPDVLVTDWMLKDHVHGLDVASAIRLVTPAMQTILITGFATNDLRQDAAKEEVYQFLEKPFQLDQIRAAVQSAAVISRPWKHPLTVGFIEADSTGAILYTNVGAEQMLERTRGGMFASNLREIFSKKDLPLLDRAVDEWVEIEGEERWMIRARAVPGDDVRLFVLLDENHLFYRYSPLVLRLLGLPENPPTALPVQGHVLVVDDLEPVRRSTVDVLRAMNSVVHTAETHEEALRLFVHDTDIRFVILDYDMPEGGPEALAAKMLELRPDTNIIGTSSASGREESFRGIGAKVFLQKPWRLDEFLQALGVSSSH